MPPLFRGIDNKLPLQRDFEKQIADVQARLGVKKQQVAAGQRSLADRLRSRGVTGRFVGRLQQEAFIGALQPLEQALTGLRDEQQTFREREALITADFADKIKRSHTLGGTASIGFLDQLSESERQTIAGVQTGRIANEALLPIQSKLQELARQQLPGGGQPIARTGQGVTPFVPSSAGPGVNSIADKNAPLAQLLFSPGIGGDTSRGPFVLTNAQGATVRRGKTAKQVLDDDIKDQNLQISVDNATARRIDSGNLRALGFNLIDRNAFFVERDRRKQIVPPDITLAGISGKGPLARRPDPIKTARLAKERGLADAQSKARARIGDPNTTPKSGDIGTLDRDEVAGFVREGFKEVGGFQFSADERKQQLYLQFQSELAKGTGGKFILNLITGGAFSPTVRFE